MSYRIHWHPDGLHAEFSGACIVSDLLEADAEVHGRRPADGLRWFLWDLSGATVTDGGPEDAQHLARTDGLASSPDCVMQGAIVVTDPHAAELARAYVAECNSVGLGWDVRVFSALADARRWLGLPDRLR